MAHECPSCGMICYCGNDIDDCLFNFKVNVMRCTHYKECEKESDDNEFTDEDAI